jgi:hypothetical protein
MPSGGYVQDNCIPHYKVAEAYLIMTGLNLSHNTHSLLHLLLYLGPLLPTPLSIVCALTHSHTHTHTRARKHKQLNFCSEGHLPLSLSLSLSDAYVRLALFG